MPRKLIDFRVMFKKMGSSKDHFLDFRVLLPGSQKYFREYLCENKNIFENILGYCSRAQVQYCRFMQKTRAQKSHATVPLRALKVRGR